MTNPGGCPPHMMLEVSRTEQPGDLPDIVTKQCNKCGYTE
jgi:hypothetical protein